MTKEEASEWDLIQAISLCKCITEGSPYHSDFDFMLKRQKRLEKRLEKLTSNPNIHNMNKNSESSK